MIHLECDQIAADTIEVTEAFNEEFGTAIILVPSRVEAMVEASTHVVGDNFEERLELTLDQFEFASELERKAYKRLLGKIFSRRSTAARERRKADAAMWRNRFGDDEPPF